MKCRIMRHFIRVYTVKEVKKIFRENFSLIPQDLYNGLSQVYYIKPDGWIH